MRAEEILQDTCSTPCMVSLKLHSSEASRTRTPAVAQHAPGLGGHVRGAQGLLQEVVQAGRGEAAGGRHRFEQLPVAAGQQDGLLRILYEVQPVLRTDGAAQSLETSHAGPSADGLLYSLCGVQVVLQRAL